MTVSDTDFTTVYGSLHPLYRWLTDRFRGTVDGLVSPLLVDNQRVLDVGCGEGFVIRYLLNRHPDLHFAAVDLDVRRIRTTKRLSPGVKAIEADAYDLPFRHGIFDMVLANEILEHLDEPDRVLEQIGHVARRYVVCSVPNEPFFSIGNLIRGAHWTRLGRTPTHVNFWSRRAFRRLLERHFQVSTVKSCFPWTFAVCEVS